MLSLSDFQKQFAKRSDLIHLNNAGLAPITRSAKDTIEYWAQRFFEEGFYTDGDYMAAVLQSRKNLAAILGCSFEEIAWYQSTAGAINQFAFGIQLQTGDEVLMWDQEYSSHLYPWKEACEKVGAQLKIIKSESDLSTPTEKYMSALSSKTKVAAFSWVQFMTGARMDVEAVIKHCKAQGIYVFVDAMQGVGIHPCELWSWGVDALAGGSHKWLYSPVGVGYLAIRKELALKMKPHTLGAYTYGTCDDPSDFACEPKRDATKFEPGSKQVLEITALGSSCQLIKQVGVANLERESLRLAKILREGLERKGCKVHSPFAAEQLSPMVNFTAPQGESLSVLAERFRMNSINFALRGPGLRLSVAPFNTESEIQKVLSLI